MKSSNNKTKKLKKEKISKKAIKHSSLGEFTKGDKKHPSRLSAGGHGEENIRELKRRGIDYNITKQYPNGVRVGNIPTHKDKQKRNSNKHTWFPQNWTRGTIKKAGEKTILTSTNDKPNKHNIYGTYKSVKVIVKKIDGKVHTIYPHYKQSGGKKNEY